MIIIIKILLLLLLFILILTLSNIAKDRQISKAVTRQLEILNKSYNKRMSKVEYKNFYTPKGKRKSIISKYDLLVDKSNIRAKFTFASTELILFISALLSIVAITISFLSMYNLLASIVIGVYVFFVPRYILTFLVHRNAEKIDNNLVFFINLLNNFCIVDDNIIYAIGKGIPFLEEPLRSFSICFINEVKHGISPFDALENFKDKVDNNRFKLLIKNLQICTKNNGSYIEVLSKSNNILRDYSIEKARRRSEVRQNRGTIIAIMLISFVIMVSILRISPNILVAFRVNWIGQLIVTFNVFIYLFAVYKCFTLERFEY